MGQTPPDMQEMVIPEPRGEYMTYARTEDHEPAHSDSISPYENFDQASNNGVRLGNIVSAPSPINEVVMGSSSDNLVYSVSSLSNNRTHCNITPSITAQGTIPNVVAPGYMTPPKTPVNLSSVDTHLQSSAQACLDAVLPNPTLPAVVMQNVNVVSQLQNAESQNTVMIPRVIQSADADVSQNVSISNADTYLQSTLVSNHTKSASVQPAPIIQVFVVNSLPAVTSRNVSQSTPRLCPIAPAPHSKSVPFNLASTAAIELPTADPGPIRSRSFICTYADCGKMYYKSSHLKAHIRVHTGNDRTMHHISNKLVTMIHITFKSYVLLILYE